NTYHRGIKQTPNEAWDNPENEMLIKINGSDTKYSEEFPPHKSEMFKEGDKNIRRPKIESKYPGEGIVTEVLGNDLYLIKENDKIQKRNHAQLKMNM
ncbi:hypothetical protein PAEPH01_2758, partial [Pancytospora epiphaga]